MAQYADGISADVQFGLNANYYLNLVSFVILYYDFILTFPMEVERFWTIGWYTWGSLIFFLNRYVSLLGHIPVIFQFFWTTPDSTLKAHLCPDFQKYHQYLVVVVQIIVGAALILRTYALYNRNRSVLILLVTTALLISVFCCWAIYSSKRVTALPQALPRIGCRKPLSWDESKRLAAAWGGCLLFDVIIFVMTLYKSLTSGRGGDRMLISVLLRDGTFYFGVMAFSTLSVILTLLVGAIEIRALTVTFTNVISSTLISRLILRLRDPKLTRKGRFPTSLTTDMVSTFVPLDSAFPYQTSGTAGNTLAGSVGGECGVKDQEVMEIEAVPREVDSNRR